MTARNFTRCESGSLLTKHISMCNQLVTSEIRKQFHARPKLLPQPITTNTNYPMNQSELEANTCNRLQARENACEQVVIGLSFTSDWS